MTRLRRVSSTEPSWRRVRSGRGFRYLDEAGRPLGPAEVARVKALVIPPAWTEVWICRYDRGHLQAVGTDAAGRRQYLYHPAWREQRDAAKFDRVLAMARRLPAVRRRVRAVLAGDPTDRETVLAAAVRLVDLGCFRLGAEGYTEENGSYGLTTLERRHVRRSGEARRFLFVGKSGVEQEIVVDDPAVVRVVDALTRRRSADPRLLAAKQGGRWRPIDPAEVNDHLRGLFGADVTAKDFRTWHATVVAAVTLRDLGRSGTRTGRARQVRAAVAAAAELLGNTPAVARSSYVDPRVLDRFEEGRLLAPARSEDGLDRAAAALLAD